MQLSMPNVVHDKIRCRYLDLRDIEISYTQRMQHKMGLEQTGRSNTVKIHYLCFQNDLLRPY